MLSMTGGIFGTLEYWVNRAFTSRYNPLYYLGQISVFLFILLAISGVYMLPFYKINVEKAYDSVEGITQDVVGGVMRSIHRYAADALVVVLFLHGLKTFIARRFWQSRWVVWVSGIALFGVVLIEGLTGYWMVWDQRAQLVAITTTEFLDVLPIFPKPLSMAIVSEGSVTNLLFFAVVFVHIALPLFSLALVLLHFSRFAKAVLLPPRRLMLASLGAVLVLALTKPALSAPQAELSRALVNVPIDWFYMFALPVIRWQPQLAWLLLFTIAALLLLVPRLLRGDNVKAEVDSKACVGCELCYSDCPYSAITMVKSGDRTIAEVAGERCAGCGTCIGSCNFNAVMLGDLNLEALEREVRALVKKGRPLVIRCEHCLGREVDDKLKDAGAGVLTLRCLGIVNPSLLSAALDAGAETVILAGCKPGDCRYRLGNLWTRARVAGERAPVLKERRKERIKTCWLMPGEEDVLLHEVEAAGKEVCVEEKPVLPLVLLFTVLAVLPLWYFSTSPAYSLIQEDRGMLLFTMSHLSERLVPCREPTVEEIKAGNITTCPRERSPVEVVIYIDGKPALSKVYKPSGLWKDGPSYAYERIEVEPGVHSVAVKIRDVVEGGPSYTYEESVEFEAGRIVALRFERGTFSLSTGE